MHSCKIFTQRKFNLHVGFLTVEPGRFKLEQTLMEHFYVTVLKYCLFTLYFIIKENLNIRKLNKSVSLNTKYKNSLPLNCQIMLNRHKQGYYRAGNKYIMQVLNVAVSILIGDIFVWQSFMALLILEPESFKRVDIKGELLKMMNYYDLLLAFLTIECNFANYPDKSTI